MKLLSLLLVLLALFSPADPAQAAVTLPESTTVIETKAFLNDISLTGELVIPEGVTEIGPQAFKGCTGLTSVTFPSTLRSIGSEAFAGCTNLTGYLYPSDDLTIAADALTGSQIAILQENPASDFTYTIADGEVTITGYAGAGPIGHLVIPEKIEGYPVTAIGEKAFECQTSLMSLNLPHTIKQLDWCAFYGCPNLSGQFYIEGTIDQTAFQECPNATAYGYTINEDQTVTITKCSTGQTEGIFKIPDYIDNRLVTVLGDKAISLYWTNNITEVIPPAGLKSIGRNGFAGGIRTMTLPATLEYIDDYAFYGCNIANLVLSGGVTEIGDYAFAYSKLESITFLNNLDKSGYGLLVDCKNLKSVTLSEGITEIPEGMFIGCSDLKSIVLPKSITQIHRIAFMWSGLTSLVLPENVKTIGENAFAFSALESVTILSDIDTATHPFNQCNSLTFVTLSENVTKIPELIFTDCSGLKSITLPMSVTSIGRQAFVGTGLTSLVLPENVKTIGFNAFAVTPLKSITFPKHVDFLDYGILSGCTNLTSVTLPENITEIPMLMFSGCTALESITLPESITYLGWCAFEDTTSLTSINLDNITETHNSVFRGSKLLTDAAARVAAQVVKADMTDFEKAKALHDWVVNNTTYYLYVAGPEGTFFMDGGSCMSYTQAYGLLLDQVGIENLYIEAPVEMAHIWNLIKLDGEWYHVDCTWDDGGDILTYEYFCLSDELIKKDHSWPYDNYPAANGTRYTNGVDHGE